jgi:ipoprotein LpqH
VIVDERFIVGAVVFAVALAGCSGEEPAPRPPGNLPAGTAEISIESAALGSTKDVSCSSNGSVTTITTGNETAGTTSAVDNSDGLTVQYVEMRNIDGFTGSYWADLGSEAEVKMAENAFHITGAATGFDDSKPSARATKAFSISVAC